MLFSELLEKSTRFDRDQFVTNLGGIVEDVSDMLSSDLAMSTLKEARKHVDAAKDERLSNGMPRLQQFEFGVFENAPELASGDVAAIDGTPVLPMQKYSAGQALCVGIGSRSYTRKMDSSLHGYTSKAILPEISADDVETFIKKVEDGSYSINLSAYMRYFEIIHALEIDEPFVFCDGTLMYEWLINEEVGRDIYKELLAKKICIGIMKSLKDNTKFAWLGRVLKPGEVFVFETLYEHIEERTRLGEGRSPTRSGVQWQGDSEFVELAKKVHRGVFKPYNKAFSFECYEPHLDPMLRIMTADCQMNAMGHEIPFLLNQIDKEVRSFFKSHIVKAKIGQKLSQDGESLFFGETDERDLR